MTREIKFRAWDKNKKEWLKCPLSYNSEMVNEWGHGGFALLYNGYIEVMQYTGLKDIDKEEIYEGDIVKSIILSGSEKVNEVTFEYGAFRIGLQPLNVQENIKVIGNKYENPELLKEIK